MRMPLHHPMSGDDVAFPLSYRQRAIWLRQQLTPEGTAHAGHYAFRLRGPLDTDALRRAMAALLARHAVLRATFPLRDGTPVQYVSRHAAVSFMLDDASLWNQATVDMRLAEEVARPFDLEQGPLLRLHLWTRTAHVHDLLLTVHDLLAGAHSPEMLLPDLAALYAAEMSGDTDPSPITSPLDVGYAEHEQDEQVAQPEAERLWTYWRSTLADAPPVLALPSSLLHPLSPTEEGAVAALTLDATLTARLEALARSLDLAFDIVLLAGFSTVLFRYTGQQDIMVGTSLVTVDAQRQHNAGLLGFRDETLPLRFDLSGEPSFAEMLHRVRQTVEDTRLHLGIPFALLVEQVAPPRAPGYAPLVQTYFEPYGTGASALGELAPLFLGREGPSLRFANLVLEPLALERHTAREDLTLRTARIGGATVLSFEFRTAVFAADDIRRLAGHVETLLTGVVDNPHRSLSMLPLLTPAEHAQTSGDLSWCGNSPF